MSIFRQLLVLAVLGGLAYGGYGYWQRSFGAAPEAASGPRGPGVVTVELVVAETRIMQRTVEAVGTTRARRSIDIVPEADGRLVALEIAPGSRVVQGEVLARLEDAIQRADLTEAEAVLEEQSSTLDRLRTLRETNAVSLASVEEAVARVAEARARVERAQRRLDDRVIVAPFDGVVGLTSFAVGARVTEGQVLARLDDLSEVEVEFGLPETVFAQVAPGQRVTARAAAFPDRAFDGAIAEVDSRIDPVSRSFLVRALIPNPDRALPAGMFLSLTLVLDEARHIVVPEEAIVFEAAQTYVFVAQDGIARRRAVGTGQRRDGVIAVTSGLAVGDAVVVRGLMRVRDGAAIEVLERDRDATASGDAATGEEPT
jgi:membrane fusion protein (multidrug efflux system)